VRSRKLLLGVRHFGRVLHRAVAEMPPSRGFSARSVRCQSRKLRAKRFEHFPGKVAPTIPFASEIAAALMAKRQPSKHRPAALVLADG
jgi:hypothetical protein